MTVQQLVENKDTLNYQQICTALIETFRVNEKINWESILPAQQQQDLFGGETLRLVAEHPILSKQKDIRPIALKRGSISQMLFFYITLNDTKLSKKNIQDVTKKFISGGDANRYIVWFFGNKENTELKVVLSAKEGKKVVLKTLPFGVNQPYYKTYNFILNEVLQKVNQLFVEPTDLWKALWKAFDISIINRTFISLLAQLKKSGNPFVTDEDRVQFAIRLIGRIIFCWFLKRKDVLSDEAISSSTIKSYHQKNYYHDLLEPLFFDVLNTPDKERKAGLPKIIAKYPFLNGGLFEAQHNDFKDHLLLDIDNDWFYTLLSKTLERYNFTVDENSSSNEEIAIDPEMLGRIFENLLAEQNPETGESARKATGSFYTPREIVDYMVEQSICEYLKTALSLDEKSNTAIEDFVHTQILPDALGKYEEIISNELNKIKVLDPACGSGAFPIGILQKIVALKQQLHPKTKNYKLKLDTIQNSIYGVDIQPMAVELSRLRCWLSLVVDEDPKDIKALPNLDFKFVCADSLVDVPLIEGYTTDALDKNLKTLEDNVEQYFSPDYKNKKKIKTEIENSLLGISKFYHNIIASYITKIRQEEKTASSARIKQLRESMLNYFQMDAKWNSYDNIFKNKKVDFFNPTFFFPSAKNGFDIVIGNPPYIGAIAQDPDHREMLSKSKDYITLHQKWDLYIAFIERGIRLSKKGVTCMIVPYPVTNQTYGKKLREFILTENDLLEISNLSGNKIFEEATVTNCILFVRNGKTDNDKIRISKLNDGSISVVDSISINSLVNDEKTFVWNISNKKSFSFTGENFVNLGNYCFISKGMVLNADEIKSKGLFIKNDLISEFETKINCKAYTEAKFIEKYKINKTFFLEWGTKRVPDLVSRPTFPELYESPKIMVSKIGKIKATVDFTNIYCDQTIRVLVLWNDLKGLKNKSIDNSVKRYQSNSRKTLEENSSQISLKYLLAVINSKLADTLLDQIRGNGNIDINPEYLKNIPIPKISFQRQKVFEIIIDFILALKENEVDSQFFERLIDAMVYELYLPDEIKACAAEVMKYLDNLPELKEGDDESNLITIESVYKELSDPKHPVSTSLLNLLTIEEINIIEGRI